MWNPKTPVAIAGAIFAGSLLSLCAISAANASEPYVNVVKSRGVLLCGTDTVAPGFGYLDPKTGKMEGMDVDFCRALAAAVFGDPDKVKYIHVTDKSRFNALAAGEIDVILAHTTMTAMRAASVGGSFTPIYFYDGSAAMVKKASGVQQVSQLNGATICTTQGSGTEVDWSTWAKAHHWASSTKVLTYESDAKTFEALKAGRCDAMSTDESALVGWRGNSGDPSAYVILPEIINKSPFAAMTLQSHPRWNAIVSYVIYATIQAEEYGITSNNLPEELKSEDPRVREFLGLTGSVGTNLGLPNDFTQKIIAAVGNYGQIYARNLGPATPWYLIRKGSENAEYTHGGLIYSPPWD